MNLTEQIRSAFQEYLSSVNGDRNSDFVRLRELSFAEFEKTGLPTIRNEEWKYTNLKPVADTAFVPATEHSPGAANLLHESLLNIAASRLVFVNGTYYPGLSQVIENNDKIVITNMHAARKAHAAVFGQHFGKYAKWEGEGLNAMNTALMSDGAFIHVPAGQSVEHPVIIMHITDAASVNVLNQPRNLVVVDSNASLKLIESYSASGAQASFTNVVNEVYVGTNASFDHYKVQHEAGETYHNNYTQIFQEADTNINHVTLTMDGKLVRNNLHFYMNGQNGNSLLYGLYITDKKNHVDNHTRVDHAQPNCFSNELYKGVMKDQSTAVFNGKIMVHVDAQKTNAYQRNQNILLSEEATVNTKPQLEIFADDVKCTHGATVGQLNEEPMFYLRSRGIPEAEARRMLLNAFADEIAEMIRIPELVQLLEEEIETTL